MFLDSWFLKSRVGVKALGSANSMPFSVHIHPLNVIYRIQMNLDSRHAHLVSVGKIMIKSWWNPHGRPGHLFFARSEHTFLVCFLGEILTFLKTFGLINCFWLNQYPTHLQWLDWALSSHPRCTAATRGDYILCMWHSARFVQKSGDEIFEMDDPDLQKFPVYHIIIYLNYFILNTHPLAYLNYFELIRVCTIRDTYYVIGMVLVCFGTGLDVLSVDLRRRKPVRCQSHEFLTNLADWSSRDMCLWPSFRINLQKGWFQPIEWGSELLQYGDVKPCWIKWLWIISSLSSGSKQLLRLHLGVLFDGF